MEIYGTRPLRLAAESVQYNLDFQVSGIQVSGITGTSKNYWKPGKCSVTLQVL